VLKNLSCTFLPSFDLCWLALGSAAVFLANASAHYHYPDVPRPPYGCIVYGSTFERRRGRTQLLLSPQREKQRLLINQNTNRCVSMVRSGAGWCRSGGDLHLPAGHGLDCRSARLRLQMAKNMRTTQHNWPGKRRKMFWVEKNRGEWGNECVSCVSNASTIFPAAAATSWLHHPPGSPPPQPPLPLVQVPSCDPKL